MTAFVFVLAAPIKHLTSSANDSHRSETAMTAIQHKNTIEKAPSHSCCVEAACCVHEQCLKQKAMACSNMQQVVSQQQFTAAGCKVLFVIGLKQPSGMIAETQPNSQCTARAALQVFAAERELTVSTQVTNSEGK